MATVDLTPYSSQIADIQRRQKLAEMLTEQGQQDIPIQSYNGTQAPIPWTAVLAKMLNSYEGAHMSKKASDALDDLNTKTAQQFATDTAPTTPTVPAPQVPAPQVPPPPMPAPPASAMPQDMQAQFSPEALTGAPTAPPTGPSPQAMAAALNAPAPSDMAPAPAPAAPMPQAAPDAPATPPAPAAMAPAPMAAPPAAPDINARLAAAQAQLQHAQALQLKYAGSPFEKQAANYVTAAQEQVRRISDLQDQGAAKEADRVANVQRTVQFIQSSTSIPPEMKQALIAGAPADPDVAKTVMASMVKDAFTHKLIPASPQDLAGYPQGTVAQKDPVSGELKNIYNPVPNLMAIANEKLHAQDVALSGARLGLENARFAADRADKANAVLDAATIQQMAMQARQGDKSVFQNLGRGQQGAQNIVALRRAIFDPALGPMTGTQMAQINANFVGATAEQRAVGTRVGNAAVAASEVPNMAALSDQAYSKLSRTEIVPFNKLKQAVESGTSSPAQAVAYAADQSVINAYARALSPTGVGTDAARAKGEKMLNTAMGPEAHRAVLNQLIAETNAIKSGAQGAMGTGQRPATPIGGLSASDAALLAKYGVH